MLLAQRGITKVRSYMYVLHALALNGKTEQHVAIYHEEDHHACSLGNRDCCLLTATRSFSFTNTPQHH